MGVMRPSLLCISNVFLFRGKEIRVNIASVATHPILLFGLDFYRSRILQSLTVLVNLLRKPSCSQISAKHREFRRRPVHINIIYLWIDFAMLIPAMGLCVYGVYNALLVISALCVSKIYLIIVFLAIFVIIFFSIFRGLHL